MSLDEMLDATPTTAELLDDVVAFVRRFVVLPNDAEHVAVALFVLHTWAFDAADATPYLAIESPEKQSGKTRLLEVLALVCRDSVKAVSITAAALFQTVAQGHPTLLIDEADAIFAGNGERNEDLRGVLNGGNLRGSAVRRGGKDGQPVAYNVFCPKVVAGIATGRLPDTVRDRAVVLPIDRKLRSEHTERLRHRRLRGEVNELRATLGAWAKQAEGQLANYNLPEPLERISDRLEEAWEPLLAIADLAGGEYPARARAAAIDLAGDGDESASASHTLLLAIRDIFDGEDKIPTRDLLAALNDDPELPFGAWGDGRGLTPHRLGQLLKPYRIHARAVRIGSSTPRGFHREQFEPAWERYGPAQTATSATSQSPSGIAGHSEAQHDPGCCTSETDENPHPRADVADVALFDPPSSMNGSNDAADDDARRAEEYARRFQEDSDAGRWRR